MRDQTLFAIYEGAMQEELKVRLANGYPVIQEGLPFNVVNSPEEIHTMVWRLYEGAQQEFVSRSYNTRYNLTKEKIVYESVAAHTNLMNTLVTHALDYTYGGQEFGMANGLQTTVDGYTYREIVEATRMHDLPENEIGDIPDNGARDETKKVQDEFRYFQRYLDSYVRESDSRFRCRVLDLLQHMYNQDSPTGKLLFLADKVSAFIATLCLDRFIKMPMMNRYSSEASERDQLEMSNCDYVYNGAYFSASEMWTMDFLAIRKTVELDETMFFTAVLVMATILSHGEWYSWRNRDYIEAQQTLNPT